MPLSPVPTTSAPWGGSVSCPSPRAQSLAFGFGAEAGWSEFCGAGSRFCRHLQALLGGLADDVEAPAQQPYLRTVWLAARAPYVGLLRVPW